MSAWADDRQASLDHIRTWRRHMFATTGPQRADARTELAAAIAFYRRFHLAPSRRAFEAAVARSKTRQRRVA
jgi:hypothetical protein